MRHYCLGVLIFLLALATAAAGLAHGLAVTIPEHDAQLYRSPESLRFVFQSDVTITSISMEIIGGEQDSTQIDIPLPRNSSGQSAASGTRIELPIPRLAPNNYQVIWQAKSADGKFLVDYFNFTVL